jgi:hypothetical protein
MAAGSNPGGFLAYKKLSKNEKQSSLRVFKSGCLRYPNGTWPPGNPHQQKKSRATPASKNGVFFCPPGGFIIIIINY